MKGSARQSLDLVAIAGVGPLECEEAALRSGDPVKPNCTNGAADNLTDLIVAIPYTVLMRLAVVVAVGAVAVAACGDQKKVAPDAAAPDASCGGPDADGDGVCDGVDICPEVQDPGQVDLDGDGIGWACDAVESTTIPNITSDPDTTAGFDAATFGIQLKANRTVVLGVSPAGLVLAQSDSGTAADAWLNVAAVQGPYVSRDGTIFVSTKGGATSTGALDPAKKAFTELVSGTSIVRPSAWGRRLEYLVLEKGLGFEVGVPSGQQQLSLLGGGPGLAIRDESVAGPSRVSVFVYENSSGHTVTSLNEGTTTTLGTFSSAKIVARLESSVGVCMSGSPSQLRVVHTGGVTTTDLPFAGCVYGYVPLEADWYFLDSAPGIAFVRGSTSITVSTTAQVATPPVVFQGTTMAVFFAGQETWVVTSNGTVVPITYTLQNPIVSTYRNTVHIVGVSGGQAVLIRYSEANGLQQVNLGAESSLANVVTTAEGGAVVAGTAGSWLVPSTSMTPTPSTLSLNRMSGSALGTTTMIFGRVGGAEPAVYAYDELAGPRLTKVSADVTGGDASRLYTRASAWFTYGNTNTCKLARIVYTNSTPSLDEVDCPLPFNSVGIHVSGGNANGDPIAITSGRVWTLNDAGARLVASGDSGIIMDWTRRTVVGWYGDDSSGGYACLASHPDRCWAIPTGGTTLVFPADASADGGDGTFALARVKRDSNAVNVTVLRTIGPGDRPPPVP